MSPAVDKTILDIVDMLKNILNTTDYLIAKSEFEPVVQRLGYKNIYEFIRGKADD